MFTLLTKKMKNRKGFTLVELMVVVAIIGILAAVAVPKFADTTASANRGKVLSDLGTIDSASSMFMANNGGTAPADVPALVPNYIAAEPTPPKGTIKFLSGDVTDGTYSIDQTSGRAQFGGKTAEALQTK